MPEREETPPTLTVPAADAENLIRMLKQHLPGARTCRTCGYEGPVGHWGYRTVPVDGTAEVYVHACCPACESPVRLRAVPDGTE